MSKKIKRVTFVTEDISFKAGVQRVQAIIANELSKEYEVTIISLFNEDNESAFYINENVKIIKVFHKFKRKNLKYFYPFVILYIKGLLRKFKTDFFIVTESRIFSLFCFMKKRSKLMMWEHLNSYTGKEQVGRFYEIGREYAAKYADKIIVLTDKDKNHFKELYNVDDDHIIRIYNPVEMVNQTHEYNTKSRKILSIGRTIKQKGFDYLIEVAKDVLEKHKDWEWHIYGLLEDEKAFNEMVQQNGLEKQLMSKGITSKIQELYKEYSMFVMTSRYEGFPMVNIEAHSAKLPIVSFDCPCGPSEIIEDGVNGYIIDCFDIDKMAERINYLIEHPEIRQEMSNNTYKDKEKLQLDIIIGEWKKIL